MTVYFTVNTLSEYLCFVISLFCLYRDKDKVWKGFILFLLLTCITETAGIYIRNELLKPNFMLYNIFLVIECTVLNLFFYHLVKTNDNGKKLLVAWLVLFLLFYFFELYTMHFKAYVSTSSTIMSVEIVLASIYFYYRLLKEEKFRQLSTYAPFWWVSGTICFYFAGMACNIFFKYLLQDATSPGVTYSARYIVFSILNVILYACWSYSFICRYFQRTSSS
jgi:hypothetical protein